MLRFQVKCASRGGKSAYYWVHDTVADKRVTQVMVDRWDDGQIRRPCAKQRCRKIAKRMNHKARMAAVA